MEFNGTDVRVYEMILRIMEEFDLGPDDLEAYQKWRRSGPHVEDKHRLEMALRDRWGRIEPVKPDDWRGFRPMA